MTNTKPLKLVLLGDPGTGKTNLWSRLIKTHFNPSYEPTYGVNFDSHTLLVGDQRVEIDLWELAGHKKWHCLADGLLRDADGILLVYDISKSATFESLVAWLQLIRETASPKTVIKLVGNKKDLLRMVPSIQAYLFATNNGLSYIETSAFNDSNIRLAFESMAQEIDVAMHSVSSFPSRDPFDQKNPKASSDDEQGKPFQVVLVEIEQAACNNTIVCVTKPLEDIHLEFIAISYRWGEVQEQVIDTELGYMASITSFGLNDFYQLCRDMMKEADLRSIKYVWVDAICVDQNNQARRKATIYQMSNIYHRAAYILAVPDLHLEYLSSNKIFDYKNSANAYKLNEFIYHLLHGNFDRLARVKEKWFDEMGLPNGSARETLICDDLIRFTDYLDVYNIQESDRPCNNMCQHNCYTCVNLDCHDTPKTMVDHIQYVINRCHHHPKNIMAAYGNSHCALCSLQMDICKHQRKSPDENEIVSDADQNWLACVLRELQYEKYRILVDKQSQAVSNFMKYLEYIIKDWSSRVWVISEYNIAKSKQSCKMKFWFLSLRIDWENVEKLDFFGFDFDKIEPSDIFKESGFSRDRVAIRTFYGYHNFRRVMSQLNRKSFLKMMLASKASRNEDRFYAIFPSTEYKHKLTSREEVSSWKIDTIVSVKLKLYEVMTIKDKLDLLYLTARNVVTPACAFPAFANINVTMWEIPRNFGLQNEATLQLIPPDNVNGNYYTLNVSPKLYFVIHNATGFVKESLDTIFNDNKKLWDSLKINYEDDQLVFVYIPRYMRNTDRQDLKNREIEHIALFGSFKKTNGYFAEIALHTLVARISITTLGRVMTIAMEILVLISIELAH